MPQQDKQTSSPTRDSHASIRGVFTERLRLLSENKRFEKENLSLRSDLESVQETVSALTENQARLEAINDRLRAPQLHEGVFLEFQDRHARVQLDGRAILVSIDDEVSVDHLTPGRVVYLSQAQNVIVAVRRGDQAVTGDVAVFDRRTGDGRMVVQSRGESLVVTPVGDLSDAAVKPGDEIVVDRHSRLAFESLPAQSADWTLDHVDKVPIDAFAGADAVRDRAVRLFTATIAHPELAVEYGLQAVPTMLLHGPPGIGKTLMARIIATEVGRLTGDRCRMVSLSGAELEDPFVGVTQQRIKRLFRELADYDGHALLFIDEAEAIGRMRGHTVGFHSDRFLATWLSELEGIRGGGGIGVIAATNRRDLLDQAFAERFSEVVELKRPNMEATAQIFAVHLGESLPYDTNGRPVSEIRHEMIDVGVSLLHAPNAANELATLRFRDGKTKTVTTSELISGRLINQCCVAARRMAFVRAASDGARGLRVVDLEVSIADKVRQLSGILTVSNAHHYLPDLPTDVHVVAVEPAEHAAERGRYLRPSGEDES